jgi:site-specific DNA recombinase
MVGEMKKARYVYYHCTGYKGKCPEPYTREEVLEETFTELLKGISFSEEVLAWVTRALRESHQDESKFHEEAIIDLQREHRRLQDRIDAMYMDKLDGRIDNAFFDRKAADLRSEQCRVMCDIETHQNANQTYIEEGVRLLDLAHRVHTLFENQPPTEKRKLLDFVLSNCRWKDGQLKAEYRKPFDMLAVAVAADQMPAGMIAPEAGNFDNWLPR